MGSIELVIVALTAIATVVGIVLSGKTLFDTKKKYYFNVMKRIIEKMTLEQLIERIHSMDEMTSKQRKEMMPIIETKLKHFREEMTLEQRLKMTYTITEAELLLFKYKPAEAEKESILFKLLFFVFCAFFIPIVLLILVPYLLIRTPIITVQLLLFEKKYSTIAMRVQRRS